MPPLELEFESLLLAFNVHYILPLRNLRVVGINDRDTFSSMDSTEESLKISAVDFRH